MFRLSLFLGSEQRSVYGRKEVNRIVVCIPELHKIYNE